MEEKIAALSEKVEILEATSEFVEIGEHSYYISPETVTSRDAAIDKCGNMSAQLVNNYTSAENDRIKSYLIQGKHMFWTWFYNYILFDFCKTLKQTKPSLFKKIVYTV